MYMINEAQIMKILRTDSIIEKIIPAFSPFSYNVFKAFSVSLVKLLSCMVKSLPFPK